MISYTDPGLDVAVLSGAGGNFCAGADLKAFAAGDRKPLTEGALAPMGPTRMRLSKPVIAAVEGGVPRHLHAQRPALGPGAMGSGRAGGDEQ